MKKLTYLSALALSFALVACDDYKEPNPPAQSNPMPEVLNPQDLAVEGTIDPTTTYSLEDLNNSGQNLVLATVFVQDLDDSYTLGANAEISVDGFEKVYPVAASVVSATRGSGTYDVVVSPDALEGAYTQNISQDPSAATIDIRFQLTASNGSTSALLQDYDVWTTQTVTILPFPPSMVIEDTYYLIGTFCDWDFSKALKFSHSAASVYDDPSFTVIIGDITLTDGNWEWQIIPQSTYDLGDFPATNYSQFGGEANAETPTEGKLIPYLDGVEPANGNLQQAGTWMMTINMKDLTYAFSSAVEFLYTPGNSNGWSQTASQLLSTKDYMNYQGYAYLDGEFKFSSAPDWNHVNYGLDTEDEGEEGMITGTLDTDGGAGNLNAPTAGLWWLTVNTSELTFSGTLITTYGLIGDATPGGWNASTPLTPSDDFLTWTAEVELTAGEIKFRANDGWDINLGGSLENLTQDGANIMVEAGTYEVTLNFGELPYSANLVKK